MSTPTSLPLAMLRILRDDMIATCDGQRARANLAPDAESDMAFAILSTLHPFTIRLSDLVARLEADR
jgi:hypothetical protein